MIAMHGNGIPFLNRLLCGDNLNAFKQHIADHVCAQARSEGDRSILPLSVVIHHFAGPWSRPAAARSSQLPSRA